MRAVTLVAGRLSGQLSHDGTTWESFDVPLREAWVHEAFISSEMTARLLWEQQDFHPGITPEDAEWDPRVLTQSSEPAKQRMFALARDAVAVEDIAAEYGLDRRDVAEWLRRTGQGRP
ncbi:hypothetical protein DVS28_b0354 (plasmid) [Euzebya pacifica]|uniref:Uncharacterized protein n=1 Tax=Euzebya pacifica TaxID=1608957 RepID=A0A346Y6M7_9ACTN|nr:hypothetical protein [Euzebya pacifica]AXV10124.1 hypothetical protein DVS28_b0354 [Euzebya pacifica]